MNIHNGKKYKMLDSTKERNPPSDVVFPSQFARLLAEYQQHPEAKSLAPDGTPCRADTKGLLRRAHITAGELRYVGKEADRKWEEGEDITSVVTPKPANGGQGKTGQRKGPETKLFYPAACCEASRFSCANSADRI